MLRIALSKGRIADKMKACLEAKGLWDKSSAADSRTLIYRDAGGKYEFILVKPSDLPVYVESGAADAGIVGKDILLESPLEIYELMDLNTGSCRMVLAGKPEGRDALPDIRRIATKYPKTAAGFLAKLGLTADIIRLEGSVELAPLVGLADAIVDIVESGDTLRANGLVEYRTIYGISTRLVANKVSYKMKKDEINEFIDILKYRTEEGL